jgi:serine/threonine kinase PknH
LIVVWRALCSDASQSSHVADVACRPLAGNLEASAYARSGWTAFGEQVLAERDAPSHFTHWVDQGVVLFPSAKAAQAFFNASAQQWPACSNRQCTFAEPGKANNVWAVGPVSNANGTLSYLNTKEGNTDGWACQRALTVANNVVIDIDVCSTNSYQPDSAVNIAHQIAAKVPT